MTEIVVEVTDIFKVPENEMKYLLDRFSFSNGWLRMVVPRILDHEAGLSYSTAHVLRARAEDGTVLGWALVRHPSKRTRVKLFYGDSYAYAGRRSDFMVYISEKHRKKGIARKLLLVAFHNFGRVDCYPWSVESDSFYGSKHTKSFHTPHDTADFRQAHYKAREIRK